MEKVLCKNCAYGFDDVNGHGKVHCCKLGQTMDGNDTCEDGKEY